MTDPCPTCGPDFVRWLNAEPARLAAWLALPRRSVDAGAVLQTVGNSPGVVWFVEQGLLRDFFLNADGLERNCAFHTELEWAGLPPPHGAPAVATFSIDALERSRVVELSHAALASWLQQRPELRVTLTDALLVNLMASSRRESALLMDSAEQRYTQFLAEHPAVVDRVALHHVASYLGITSVALSRVRRRIRDRQG
jgi:CRP-like cAMP-binding protein